MNFDDLVASLPTCADLPLVDSAHCRDKLTKIKDSDPQFVPPTLAVKREIRPEKTSLILVEAPGAVGKSMLAKALAHKTGATLWDLAQLTLGDNTLRGTVARCFGVREDALYEQVIGSLKDGSLLVILDALDEGRLGSGEGGFQAFLNDLADFSRSPGRMPSVILLARRDAAEMASLWFEAALAPESVPYAHLDIEFFDRQTAELFIDKRLDFHFDRHGEDRTHRRHRRRFEEARDTLFQRALEVMGATWKDEVVRGFLGYAPVLEGIAAFLSDPEHESFSALVRSLKEAPSQPGPSAVWRLFADVLEGVLAREHLKVKKQMESRLAVAAANSGWDSWDSLYTPDEQRHRLLAEALRVEPPSLPAGLPPLVRQEYENALRQHLGDHPFSGGPKETDRFASVVFRDDVYGWALVPETSLFERLALLRSRMLRDDYAPSVILAWSIMARSQGADREVPTVGSTDFGFLYEALRSYGSATLKISAGDEPGFVDAQVVGQATAGQPLAVEVRLEGEGIVFPRHLAHASVVLKEAVTLGVSGGRFYLGPNVDLECAELLIASEDVVVNSGAEREKEEHRHVILAADACVHGQRRPHVEGIGLFQIRCPDIQAPWTTWAASVRTLGAKCEDEFGADICRALRYLANRAPSVVNLEDYRPDIEAIQPAEAVLRAAGILVENPRSTAGQRGRRPAVPQQIRMLLRDRQNDIANGFLPEEIRGLLREALRTK